MGSEPVHVPSGHASRHPYQLKGPLIQLRLVSWDMAVSKLAQENDQWGRDPYRMQNSEQYTEMKQDKKISSNKAT